MKSLLFLLLVVGNAYANCGDSHIVAKAKEGGHSGNGGDPAELAEFTGKSGEKLESWYTVKQDLIKGFELGKHTEIDLGKFDKEIFKNQALEALRCAKVEWDDLPIVVEGVARPCENYTDSEGKKRIHCNRGEYASAMKNYDAETQYKMIAHEYFGAAGLEPNRYNVSDYPFSSQISQKLKKVTVKRWALEDEKVIYPGIQCEIKSRNKRGQVDRSIVFEVMEGRSQLNLFQLNYVRKNIVSMYSENFNMGEPMFSNGTDINNSSRQFLYSHSKVKLNDGRLLEVGAMASSRDPLGSIFIQIDGVDIYNGRHCYEVDYLDQNFRTNRRGIEITASDQGEKLLMNTLKWLDTMSYRGENFKERVQKKKKVRQVLKGKK